MTPASLMNVSSCWISLISPFYLVTFNEAYEHGIHQYIVAGALGTQTLVRAIQLPLSHLLEPFLLQGLCVHSKKIYDSTPFFCFMSSQTSLDKRMAAINLRSMSSRHSSSDIKLNGFAADRPALFISMSTGRYSKYD